MAKKTSYTFNGSEGKEMNAEIVQGWIQRHQDQHVVRAHFFGKKILQKILDQPGCMGIRFHYAIDDKNQKTLIIVGADAKGNNMWPTGSSAKGKLKGGGDGGGTTGDQAYPCPPYC